MTAASLALETLLRRLHVVGQRTDLTTGQPVYDARCPAHDDSRASFSFGPGATGGVVMHCHAGCSTQAILDALGLTFADISPEPHIEAIYSYKDEDGRHLWDVERWCPKDFRCRPGLPPPAQRRLYHSEWLPRAREEGRTVWCVEGEKDADTLAKQGEIAVCGVGGAGSWLGHYADQLHGLDVIIITDNDDPGRAHARAVARSLDGRAASLQLVAPSWGKDITDQIDAGYPLSTLVPLSLDETLGIHRADQVREREVTWLWPGYLPAGKLTIVEGDPGDGKSVMTCDLAARFSTGAPLPDGSKAPIGPTDVVMISAEDDPEDTIRPRLRVAGADLRRVHLVLEGSIPGTPFDLLRDLPALEQFITTHHVGLVVIDPLMAFVPGTIDAYKDAEVRRLLWPITTMAMRTVCAVLLVRHLVKSRTKAISAGGGSMGFVGAARVAYLVGPHPDDETKRAFSPVKCNIAPKPATLAYQVVADRIDTKFPRVIWDSDPLDLTAQEVLDGEDGADERDARADAKEFLIELLSANHSGLSWQDIIRHGKREGLSEITLRRIRKQVAHQIRNPPDKATGNPRKGTFWFLTTKAPVLQLVPRDEDDEDDGDDDEPQVETPEIPQLTFLAPPEGGCDICGTEPAISFGAARRCSNHNPMTYDDGDPA